MTSLILDQARPFGKVTEGYSQAPQRSRQKHASENCDPAEHGDSVAVCELLVILRLRRTWTWGKVGQPKSKASQAPVPMHLLLAEFMRAWQIRTTYPQPEDWAFPSFRLDGRKPRAANMLVEDHLRPAAVKAGVIAAGDPCRFGFHNLRHSLASFLVRSKTDPKTVQGRTTSAAKRSQSLDTDRASATLTPSREWSRLVLFVCIWWWLRQNLLSPAMFLCLHLPHDCLVLFGVQPLAP